MNRINVLIERSIATASPSRSAGPKPAKMVYENTRKSTANPAIARNSTKNSNTIFAAEVTAKRTIVSGTKKPDIVSVTADTTKALMPYVDKINQSYNQPTRQDFINLQPELKAKVSEYIFENKNNSLEILVDPNSSLFKAFRKVVLKEGPDVPLTMQAIKKFSDYRHKAELELGKRFAIISSIDSKYENAGVFRPKNPITAQVSASEYLQTVWEMTDEERSVFEIFSKEYVQHHLSFFENGAVTNMDFSSYSRFVKNATTVGRPGEKGGRWVQPKDTIGKAFQYQKENPHLSLVDVLTKKLGWSQDYLKNNVLLALIDESTSSDELQMPTRNHLGANGFFFDSGHTHGTLELEAIAPVIEKAKLAIGIWGLPEDHALHPSNAKPGNYLEVEKFLSSEVEVENIKRLMNAPLQELKPSDL